MENFGLSLGLYVFLLSNVTYSLHDSFLPAIQTWSIGVEEQFYLIWPWLFRRSGYIYAFIWLFFIVFLVFKTMLLYAARQGILGEFWGFFIDHTRLDCMAVGGLGAFMLYYQFYIVEWIFNRWVQLMVFVALVFFLLSQQTFSLLNHTIYALMFLLYALMFLLVIMNVSSNERSIININPEKWFSLESGFFKFLGRISYGIYMYHMLYLVILAAVYQNYFSDTKMSESGVYLIYILVSGLTVLTAHLSYKYFEKPFMKLKVKYATVLSGEPVVQVNN